MRKKEKQQITHAKIPSQGRSSACKSKPTARRLGPDFTVDISSSDSGGSEEETVDHHEKEDEEDVEDEEDKSS